MDFEILTEAEADILHWKRYSSYTFLLYIFDNNKHSDKKYLLEFILSQIKITEGCRTYAMANLKKKAK